MLIKTIAYTSSFTFYKKITPEGQSVLPVCFHQEAYTPEQIESLKQLLSSLVDRFKKKLQADRNNFCLFQNPATLPMGINSHTTVRKDKTDIFPQKEIIDLVSL